MKPLVDQPPYPIEVPDWTFDLYTTVYTDDATLYQQFRDHGFCSLPETFRQRFPQSQCFGTIGGMVSTVQVAQVMIIISFIWVVAFLVLVGCWGYCCAKRTSRRSAEEARAAEQGQAGEDVQRPERAARGWRQRWTGSGELTSKPYIEMLDHVGRR